MTADKSQIPSPRPIASLKINAGAEGVAMDVAALLNPNLEETLTAADFLQVLRGT
jgi:hypothetical protein